MYLHEEELYFTWQESARGSRFYCMCFFGGCVNCAHEFSLTRCHIYTLAQTFEGCCEMLSAASNVDG